MNEMNVKNKTIDRFLLDREQLADRIGQVLLRDGNLEVQPGVFFYRNSVKAQLNHGVIEPSLCVIAQGSKEVFVGGDCFRYDPAHYLIATMELPIVGKIVNASPALPYLSFRLVLDPAIVTSVMVESGIAGHRNESGNIRAMNVSPLEPALLDAIVRLVCLTAKNSEYRVLAPLVIREIIYRLLTGDQAARLCHVATIGGQDHRMVQAVKRISDDFAKPLRIDSIAGELGMSVSGFHAHFKSVTAMSPLQFQKNLRLQEARRLMLSENLDAGEAGFRVGYEDQSHFSREYKRLFGKPPMRDVERMREITAET